MAGAGGGGAGMESGRGAGLTPPLLMRLARAGGGGRDGQPVEMRPPFWLPLAAGRLARRFQFCHRLESLLHVHVCDITYRVKNIN